VFESAVYREASENHTTRRHEGKFSIPEGSEEELLP
jgi:hypothetical protein